MGTPCGPAHRSTSRRRRWIGLLMLLAVLLAGCGQPARIVDAGAAPTQHAMDPTPRPAASRSPSPSPSAQPPSPGEDATRPPGDPEDGTDRTPAGRTTTVALYFTRGERVEAVSRVVPRVARIGSAAIEQLLAGPTATEVAAGYGTQIPGDTRLRDLVITDGVAVVDLSGEFESGGGTLGLTLRLAQVACTLDAFPTVDGVRFALDGEVVDVFSGDGLVIDEPVTCSDYTEVSAAGADGASPPPVPEPS
jgi:hypothetical protein